jgi:C4-dicarboxylate transporter, DctM subunit
VIYGITTETHIGKLFAAGILPGLLGIATAVMAVQWTVYRKPKTAPQAPRADRAERRDAVSRIWTVAALFALVLGGIYGGFFTATEAGGIGAAGALFFTLMRRLSLRQYYDIFRDTAQTTAALFALIIGAHIFTQFVNYTGAHQSILSIVRDGGLSPFMVMLVIVSIYILLGCILDSLAMMLLTLPMFFPIVIGLGYDPVWFGILVVVLVELGMITPPLGINLFILRSIAPEVPLATIIRGIIPFVAADVVRVAIIAFVPAVSLFLPNLFFN